MTMRRIIGISGPSGAGKSFVARHLVGRHGFTLHKMASPLKNMLRAVGLDDRHIEGELKEVPCDALCGQTPRYAMQTLGTEWGRDLLSQDLWIRLWQATMPDGDIVTDDVRFANEASTIRAAGGIVIRLGKAGDTASPAHASELFDFETDITIVNHFDDGILANLDEILPRKMTGFLSTLTPEQKTLAAEYRGEDRHGEASLVRK